MSDLQDPERIAIVGMAGRFPGADNVDEFWANLCNGVESIRSFSDEELAAAGVDASLQSDPDFVNAGAVMRGADGFDAAFFGMNAREAELTDPQHRVFLECAWSALEHAGYAPQTFDGRIGVFGGVAANTYFQKNVLTNRDLMQRSSDYQLLLASEREYAITRVAYKLGLEGPAVSVNTACSTSAVAVHLAVQSLMSGESDLALAGGARIRVPLTGGYVYQQDGILSPDGHCRAFDIDARGTVAASGVAIVALKRLSDARRDGDTIFALIRGTAVNNDGAAKVGYTAPGLKGQIAVIDEALAVAEVNPGTIGMVEAHGTGTSLGDPIEVAALTEVFRRGTDERQYCAIGSLKTNIGHLDAAAGVAGIIKAALALHTERIPPSLHFRTPNPQIDLGNSPFFVNTELRAWPRADQPRRAGVSSFGLGGTNAHVVLEEGPAPDPVVAEDQLQVLTLSAKSEEALARSTSNLAEHLATEPPALADVAYTLQEGRRHFEHRRSVVAASVDEAIEGLRDATKLTTSVVEKDDPMVAFLFPGGGAQHAGMATHLYRDQPVFRQALDRCAESLRQLTGTDLGEILSSPTNDEMARQRLQRVSVALPALFSVEYALAQLWLAFGVRPTTMIGHSLGEYVAATVAGVFSLDAGLGIVAERGRLMEEAPPGAMLSVGLAFDEVAPYLDEDISLAVVNTAENSVLSGAVEAIEALKRRLASDGVDARPIPIAVASHSVLMEPVLPAFERHLRGVSMARPQIPFVSNVTGTWITDEEATDPSYWTRHLRSTVRFADGVSTILAEDGQLLIEVGPGQTLTSIVRQHSGFRSSHQAIPSLPHPRQDVPDDRFFLGSVGAAWRAGSSVDWAPTRAGQLRRRVPLPTYPFEHQRYWVSPRSSADPFVDDQPRPGVPAASSAERQVVTAPNPPRSRADYVADQMVSILSDLSGIEPGAITRTATFIELGFDSLFLTQANSRLKKRFEVNITLRHLFEDAPTVEALSRYIDENLPPDAFREELAVADPSSTAGRPAALATLQQAAASQGSDTSRDGQLERMLRQQLSLMEQQIELLKTTLGPSVVARGDDAPQRANGSAVAPASEFALGGTAGSLARPTPVAGPIQLSSTQRAALDDLTERYCRRTQGSKAWTDHARKVLADNRAVAGFDKLTKEMTYLIVSERSKGSHLWDVDGNEYVDLAMSFGAALAGHSPDFVVEAVERQLTRGFEVGIQSQLAGEVAELLCELTGNERVTFAHSGSEAVEYAIRIARAVTARDKVVYFAGDIHGRSDIVLARTSLRNGEARTFPGTTGIPEHVAGDAVVLDYGTPEALEWIRAHAEELAAVLVEPVRTRNPDLQPIEFLRELRNICDASGSLLVFDEVVTGFRVHNGGVQAHFDIRADLVTYGKALGGGMPIGAVAGKGAHLDVIDGGAWRFGDDSRPEVGVTVSGGTMIKHPIALAAAKAMLSHLKSAGGALQSELAERTRRLASELNEYYREHRIPVHIEQFSSFFLPRIDGDRRFEGLFFSYLRERGVHIYMAYPCFLSFSHSEEDVRLVLDAFKESAEEMVQAGFFERTEAMTASDPVDASQGHGASLDGSTLTRGGRLALTDAQRDVWLVAQLGEAASAAYHLSTKLRLKGDLDIEALRESLRQLVGRHEALRITFDPAGEHQIVREATDVELPIVDLSDSTDLVRSRRVEEIAKSEVDAPYDLEGGPLFRARLIKLDDADYTLVLSAHHLICDGWSFGVLQRDLGAIYSATRRGEPVPRAEITQFSEYVDWHVNRGAESEQFWLDMYEQPPLPLDLPTDHARPPVRGFECRQERALIDRDVLVALRELAAAEGVTLFTVLLGAWEIFLHRLSGQRDFALGLFVAGQASMGARDLAGLCVNFLPLRGQLTPDESLSEFLARLRWDIYDAFDHQHYTVGKLASTLNLPRDASRPTVVSTVITLETPTEGIHFDGLQVEASGNAKSFGAFDLEAYLNESEDALSIEFQYSRALFDSNTIRRWLGHFTTLLQQMTTATASPISRLPLLDDSQQDDLLVRWNDTQAPIPAESTHQLFERQAGNDPDRVAIQTSGGSLTYGELNARANRLARHLQGLGVGAGRLVGVHLQRSPDMVVALLAVHKAGGAYVPLDPLFPNGRLAMIAEDARLHVLISQDRLVGAIAAEGAVVVALDRDLAVIARHDDSDLEISSQPSDLAYVIYTSGSTGAPKGVEVTNLALTNLLASMQRRPGLAADDVLLAVTTISFDIAALEIFLPLIVGARLVLAGEEEAVDAIWLRERLAATDITVMQATPATWQLLLDAGWQGTAGLKALCGGEALSPELAAAIGHRVESLWNMYGPTETTIWSSAGEVTQRDGPVTIGQPIANTELFVLGPALELQPPGIPGELYIGGIGLARGYRDQPDLTAERFVMHSFDGETPRRLYRTGDQVRRFADGRIEFIGRADFQVKIRGYRIELGEIETVLARHPDVKDCVVVARSGASGTKRLVAYLVPTGDRHDDVSALRMYLRESLPDYMVPSQFVVLDAFPLTANKKVDRARLPDPDRQRPDLVTELVAPRTEVEATLARIWMELLDVEQVGINDNFFDLGGDSLLALRCIMQANRSGMSLAPISIFRHQTIAELALAAGEAGESRTGDQGVVTGPTPLTPAQLRFLNERDTPDAHHWNLSALVQAPQLSPTALRTAVGALLLHHDSLRLRLWREGGRWVQEIAAPSEDIPFESHDVSQLTPQERTAAIERVCAELQASFDLDRGVLLKVAHFACGPGEPDRLFVAIHHFAVDGMSWSVFWEDLEQAYRQAADGASVSLPPKTTSFKAWTIQLEQLAQTPRVVDSAEAWLRRPWNEVAKLPADLDADARSNTNGSAAQVVLELSADDTRRLLGGNKRPEHVIIAALARCLSTWTASRTILIDILGHGRDAVSDEVNLSRTVGFTLSYNPLVLSHPTWDATPATLEAVTAQIDEQPEGFSFELLRFLAPDPGLRDRLTELPRSELLFNYSVNAATQLEGALWRAAAESIGPDESPHGLRQYPLAVRATLAPNLRLAFVYSTALHRASTVEAKAAEVGATIRLLLERR